MRKNFNGTIFEYLIGQRERPTETNLEASETVILVSVSKWLGFQAEEARRANRRAQDIQDPPRK
jgi:hypothetical protein